MCFVKFTSFYVNMIPKTLLVLVFLLFSACLFFAYIFTFFHLFRFPSNVQKKNNTKHIFGSLTPFNIKVLLQLRMKIYHFEYILTWILGQYISSLSFFLSFVPFCCVAEKMRHSSLSFFLDTFSLSFFCRSEIL